MAEKTDRRIRENRLLFIIIGIVFFASVGGALLWNRMGAPDIVVKAQEQSSNQLIQPPFRNEPLVVTLYHPRDGMLVPGTASVKRQPDSQAQAREALAALLQDPRSAEVAVLRDIKLRAFFLNPQGTAYVDFTPVQQRAITASGWDEQLAIYAIVNTLMQNFEEIRQVAFLVDGKDVETLAGHVDLMRKFSKRMDLVKQ